jgi:hypothetical protein
VQEPIGSPTRSQIEATIQECATRLHHFDTGGGTDKQALNEAGKLLIAVTMYEQLLVEAVGFLPCGGRSEL